MLRIDVASVHVGWQMKINGFVTVLLYTYSTYLTFVGRLFYIRGNTMHSCMMGIAVDFQSIADLIPFLMIVLKYIGEVRSMQREHREFCDYKDHMQHGISEFITSCSNNRRHIDTYEKCIKYYDDIERELNKSRNMFISSYQRCESFRMNPARYESMCESLERRIRRDLSFPVFSINVGLL